MMDEQLFGEASTLGQTFERSAGQSSKGAEGGAVSSMDDVDLDLNLLKNLLESHSQSLGMPLNPASTMLAQFGLALPTPPPMADKKEKKNSAL